MEKSFKKKLAYFILIPIIVVTVMIIGYFFFFWWNFMRVKSIEMEYLNTKKCRMSIPVRYFDRTLTRLSGDTIYTKGKYRYILRQDNVAGNLWITVSRLEFGGLVAYTARYEITNSEVKEKLLKLQQCLKR